MVSFAFTTLKLVRRWKPDVIHAHWILPAGMMATIAHRAFGVPYILSVHGADVFALQSAIFAPFKRLTVARASFVGPTSAEAAEALPAVDEPPPIEVLPMGVDVDGISHAVGDRHPERGRFLFVGRLAEKKGVDVLLRAIAEVPEAKLVIGGDGESRPRLLQLSHSLGLATRVEFLGHLQRREVLQQLRLAHSVVIPSRVAKGGDQDTTPLVMSESMSARVPIIASALGGLRERITDGETGILVQPGSVESLTRALRFALTEPSRLDEMAHRAQATIAGSPLDLRFTRAAYREILASVIDGSERRR